MPRRLSLPFFGLTALLHHSTRCLFKPSLQLLRPLPAIFAADGRSLPRWRSVCLDTVPCTLLRALLSNPPCLCSFPAAFSGGLSAWTAVRPTAHPALEPPCFRSFDQSSAAAGRDLSAWPPSCAPCCVPCSYTSPLLFRPHRVQRRPACLNTLPYPLLPALLLNLLASHPPCFLLCCSWRRSSPP